MTTENQPTPEGATNLRIKPVIIIPPGIMSDYNVKKFEKCGFAVIIAKDPSQVKYLEPPLVCYSGQEQAAMKLCRWIMGQVNPMEIFTRREIGEQLAKFLIEGTPMSPVATIKSTGK